MYSDTMNSPVTSPAQIARLRTAYDRCFGCGDGNPIGIQLSDFTQEKDGASAPFVARTDYNGFDGVVHGGVIATALDEISAWACVLSQGVFVFTATLEIRYRKVVRTDAEYTLRARVVHRRGKRLNVESSLRSGNTVLAEATGLFVVANSVESMLDPMLNAQGSDE